MYLALAVLCSTLIAPAAPAQQVGPEMLEVASIEQIVLVRAVDQQARSVTVETPQGDLITVNVPPESQNLDQVYPGARFLVRYLQAVATFLSKAGGAPSAEEISTLKLAEKGDTPAAVLVNVRQIEARVDTANYQDRTVLLTGPDGEQIKLSVDDQVKDFDGVNAGDKVVVRYTEALALRMISQ
jgi:hypothetical protein